MWSLRRCVLIFGVVLSACSNTVSLDYKPTSVVPPNAARPVIAVGAFSDQHGEEASYLGTIRGGFGNPLKRLYTAEPINETVRKPSCIARRIASRRQT